MSPKRGPTSKKQPKPGFMERLAMRLENASDKATARMSRLDGLNSKYKEQIRENASVVLHGAPKGPEKLETPNQTQSISPARPHPYRLLFRSFNVIVDLMALILAALSCLSLGAFGPNAVVPLFIIEPYAHTTLLWTVVYLLLHRSFWPFKVFYFVFLWMLQEVLFNIGYFIARFPVSLEKWNHTVAPSWDWYGYMYVLITAGAVSYFLLRRRVRIDWRLLPALAGWNLVLIILKMPMVSDPLANVVTPGLWWFEVLGGLVSFPIYLLMFREKKSR